MTETQMIIMACIVAYFAFLIWIGIRQSKLQDHHGFVIGGRDVGFIPTIGSLAAGFRDGAGIVMWIGFAYTVGYGGMWVFLGVFVGFLIFSFMGPRVRALSIENDYITVGQMLRQMIGKTTDRVASLVILVFALLAMAIQLKVSGNLFATILGQPEWIGLLVVGAIVAFYLFEGGYGSVIKTDTIQFVLIVALLAVPFFMDVHKEDVLNVGSIVSMGWYDSLALFLIGLFLPIATADTWQRVFSAKNDNVIRYGFPAAGPFLIVMTLTLIFIGFGLKDHIASDQTDQLVFLMFEHQVLDTWLLSFIAVVLMAITMSTLDTQTYLFTATILKNFVPKDYTTKRESYIRLSKIVIILAMIVMGLIAMSIGDIIQFLFDAVSLVFVLGPVFVFTGFGWFKSSKALDLYLTANIIVCCAIYIFLFVNGHLADMMLTMLPAGLSIIGCTVGVYLSHKVFDAKDEAAH